MMVAKNTSSVNKISLTAILAIHVNFLYTGIQTSEKPMGLAQRTCNANDGQIKLQSEKKKKKKKLSFPPHLRKLACRLVQNPTFNIKRSMFKFLFSFALLS